MGVMDILLAFPSLILAIAIVTVLGPGLLNTLLAIGIVSIPVYARIMRASVLSIKQQDYVLAGHSIGSRLAPHHVPEHPAQRAHAADRPGHAWASPPPSSMLLPSPSWAWAPSRRRRSGAP